MNNKTKMFSNLGFNGAGWTEVTSGDRNQLVFEHLNKSYGAYEIRNNYDRTLLKSLASVVLITLFISGFSFFLSRIRPVPIIPDTPAIEFEPPVFDLPKTPPVDLPKNPPSGPKNLNTFTQPVITTDSIEKKDTTHFFASSVTSSPGNPNDSDDTGPGITIDGTVDSDSKPTKPLDSFIYLFRRDRNSLEEIKNFSNFYDPIPEYLNL